MSSAQIVECLEPRQLLTASVNIEPTNLVYTGTATVPVTVVPVVSVSDSSPTLTSATITVSSGYQSGSDTLSFHNTSLITGNWVPGTGTLTLSGTTTLANYALALESVQFLNSGTNTSPRTISISVNDGSGNSGTVTRVLDQPPRLLSINTTSPSSPTNVNSVTFTATFSEPVTGVTAGAFALAEVGIPGPGQAQPTVAILGSGSVYTLTVSGITGNGTLGLNLTNGAAIKDILNVPLDGGSSSFASQVTYAAGTGPASIALSDLTQSGTLDMVTANATSNNVSVLLGTVGGAFAGQTTFATGMAPDAVAVADLTGNGIPDIVVANNGSNTISVLMQNGVGNGNGTFAAQQTFATGIAPDSVTVGDVNHDGVPDIIVANATSNTVSVLIGNGDGTFKAQQTFATGTSPDSVALGYLNADNFPDLVVANGGDGTVSVLLGTGTASLFGAQHTYATGTGPAAVAVGDLNGDSKNDIVVANATGNDVSVLLGNGDGTFQAQVTYATGTSPDAVVIGDMNGDGKVDLVVANKTAPSVGVLAGNGDGTFQTMVTFGSGSAPSSLAFADLNGDGKPDLVVANSGNANASVLLSNVNGNFTGQTFTIDVAPTVTTPTSAIVTTTTATLGGTVTSNGGNTLVSVGVVYALASQDATPTINDGFSAKLTVATSSTFPYVFTNPNANGLLPGSTYSYAAYATNSGGTSYSTYSTFTTAAAAPTVTTPTSASVTSTSATLGGDITSNDGSAITASGVVYSLTSVNSNPMLGGPGVTPDTTGPMTTGVFTLPETGLTPNSYYSYAAYATNSLGTTYTSVSSFTTLPIPPVLSGIEGTVDVYSGSTPVNVTQSLTVTDANVGVDIQAAAIVISSGYVSGSDSLSFTPVGNITGTFSSATGILTLTGDDTPANYTTALQSVTFTNSGTNTSPRTISFALHDTIVPLVGGTNNSNTVTRVVDAAPNLLSINRNTPSNPTTANSVTFTATFSETVTGVAASDFGLVTTGTIASSAIQLTGSGSTYTLTVNNILGNGTLGVNLTGIGSIIDSNSLALSSGSFTGQIFTVDVAPTITTPTKTSITATTATLGGDITGNGGNTVTASGILYAVTSVNSNPTYGGTGVTPVGSAATFGVFTVPVTGLTRATQYSFVAYVTNNGGASYVYTPVTTFTTSTTAPVVTTPTSASIAGTSAMLGGDITDNGGLAITARGVVYALTSVNASPQIGGTGVTVVSGGTATGVFTENASSLVPASNYSYVAYATNSDGTTYTTPVSTFTTLATAPTVTTPTSASITSSTATLGGDITASNGQPVTASGVVYALTSVNPNPQLNGTGVTPLTGSGLAGVFTAAASGLTPGASYSFAAYATNSVGTTYTSPVSTFSALPVLPTVTLPTSASIGSTTATLGGDITDNGGATITASGVVYAITSVNPNPQIGGTGVTNVTSAVTSGVFTVNATGLALGTSYSYFAYATNSVGTTYTTAVATFTTLAILPTVTNPTAASVTGLTATLGGDITNNGGATITASGVVYALTSVNSSPQIGGTGVTNVPSGATSGVFTVPVTGLTPVSGYSYAAYATNSQGTTYTTAVFATIQSAPFLSLPTSTNITGSEATLGGDVTYNGGSVVTSYGVAYAITSVNSNPQIGGTGVVAIAQSGAATVFTQNLIGLLAGTQYSYVAFAFNNFGVGYTSPAATFTTLPVLPTVTTPTSPIVTSTTATLGGDITDNGGGTITASGVVYSLTSVNPNPQIGGTGVTNATAGATSGVFTTNVSSLLPGSSYSFAAYATNSAGTTYTSQVGTFTTSAVEPTVTSPTSSTITATAATLGGDVTNNGGGSITATGVVYALTSINSNPQIGGTGVIVLTAGAATGVFTVNASGLTPGASYSFVAYATNSVGTSYTTPASTFTTLAVVPIVTTPTSTTITSSTATLGGNITSSGGATVTASGVVYSLTSVNSNPQIGGTGVTNLTGSGTTGVFTANASSLTPGATYSFVAYATNSIGTTYTTPVATFTTLAVAPTVTSPTSANLTSSTATLGGNVSDNGGAAITSRGVIYALTSIDSNPQIGDLSATNVTVTGTTGIFTTNVSGLTPGSSYSYVAYATNSAGTTYTSPVSTFTTVVAPSLVGSVGAETYVKGSAPMQIFSNLVVSDSAGGTIASATVSLTNWQPNEDRLSFSNLAALQHTFTVNANNLTATLVLTGNASVLAYQQTLQTIVYQDVDDYIPFQGARGVSLTVSDGATNSNALTGTISVQNVDLAPLLSNIEPTPLVYTANTPPVPISMNLLVTDPDSYNLTRATVQITSGYQNNASGQDILSFVNQYGITGSFNAATGTLTLTGASYVGDYRVALQSVLFSTVGSVISTAPRTLTITVADDNTPTPVFSAPVTRTVTVNALLGLSGVIGNETFVKGSPPMPVAPNLIVSDSVTPGIVSATVTFTNWQPEDRLDFNNTFALQHTFTVNTGNNTAVLSLTGNASAMAYQQTLQSVVYQDVNNNLPTVTARGVSITVNDGVANSNALSGTITVQNVNLPPVLSALETTPLVYAPNTAAVAISSTLLVADPDSSNLTKAVIQITAGYQNNSGGKDVLSFVNQNGITGSFNAATGTLTLTGTSYVGNYRTAIRSVMLSITGTAVSTATRTLTITVSDDGSPIPATSASVTRNVSVT